MGEDAGELWLLGNDGKHFFSSSSSLSALTDQGSGGLL